MSQAIYRLIDKKKAEPIGTVDYEAEHELQFIIQHNPDLLLRAQDMDNDNHLHLVKRELPLPGVYIGDTTLSLDHFMVDNNAVPVLVEVKKVSNPQSRREVVGQMLDYAARLSHYDSMELRDLYMNNNEGEDAPTENSYEFWKKVSTNIRLGHFRLVFAADEIPNTLRVLIELLDRSMPEIDVYGVEIARHSIDGKDYLSTQFIQNSTKALSASETESTNVKWSDANMEEYLAGAYGEWAFPFYKTFREKAKSLGFSCKYGSATYINVHYKLSGSELFYFSVGKSGGSIYFKTSNIAIKSKTLNFDNLLNYLKTIDPEAKFTKTKHPALLRTKLSYYSDTKNQNAIFELLNRFVEEK